MSALILTRPLMRNRLSAEIENILLKSIIKGQLVVGEKLPTERELARDLEVNRSTVREALGRLESLDLVEIRHGDGVYVKNYQESGSLELIRAMIRLDERQRDDIIEALLEFRSIIGPEMAFRAAKNRTDDHIQALEEVIWKNRELSTLEKDIRVHHIIGLASANILYLTLLNFFNKFVIEYGHLYFNDEENVKRSERFHEEIYQAIKKGNAGLARKIMRDVLTYAQKAVVDTLQTGRDSRR
ncbi:MAG: FadR/GntR family transcriptional regulator [Desulfomonilia bacterium]|jgi:GntR family transcriptional repressor for pyruvate dehydrogenase complex|uniref:Fatty acid metabolism regulator protein n=1 Tax=anaerobic digester metagenome TaxID=1263854 RepID=A0A485M3H4_9ZZZZ|nr:FadR/GntR family transcriptional regulator [Pseudomonadota bacterium]HPD22225.1 FadR/GntR family transcriptional regulator [Deltaproteobacteria bacterium]HPX19610.1 FadR/GntR family transcriptional regulator [Deltaproteobacteria bacterium]HRS57033.1 FadR/GntR family transcriptional regulator [Desulfomonilia bacterium]HRV36604.1 FadR/GntR family transcriptional regulator [Desulfomonilia bacterium]